MLTVLVSKEEKEFLEKLSKDSFALNDFLGKALLSKDPIMKSIIKDIGENYIMDFLQNIYVGRIKLEDGEESERLNKMLKNISFNLRYCSSDFGVTDKEHESLMESISKIPIDEIKTLYDSLRSLKTIMNDDL